MLSESQLTEIRNYLLSKKLPIDILIEVNDHFISQILELEKEENLSFKDAFEKTKNDWKDELKLRFNLLSFNYITKFESRIIQKFLTNVILKSLGLLALQFVLNTIIFKNFNKDFSENYLLTLFWIGFTLSVVLIIMNYKLIKSCNSNYKKRISIYQNYFVRFLNSGFVIIAINIFIFNNQFEKIFEAHEKILNMDFSNINKHYIVSNIFILFLFTGIFNLMEYKKVYKKLSTHLKISL